MIMNNDYISSVHMFLRKLLVEDILIKFGGVNFVSVLFVIECAFNELFLR